MTVRYTLLLPLALCLTAAHADHFAGGTITTRCTGNNFHEVTLQLFRNCSGTPLGLQTLNFSNDCGVVFSQTLGEPFSVEDVSPLCAEEIANSTCNGGSLIGYDLTTYRTTVYLSPCSGWRISWAICCRNASLNLQGTPGLYVETTLTNVGGQCNTAPEFVNNTVPMVCIGQPVSHDAGATAMEGHDLRYELIDARFGGPDPTPVLYASGFSGAEPFTDMAIDSLTGQITFLPTAGGIIVTVVKVTDRGSDGAIIGTVMRDFLFVASSCSNSVPSVDSGTFAAVTGTASIDDERSLLVCGEGGFCASMAFADANVEQALTITSDLGEELPGATLELTGTNPVAAQLCWNSTGLAPGNYLFTITATDDACPVVGVQLYTYVVKVGASGLAGSDAELDVCENEGATSLLDALGGDPSPNGAWLDPDGDPMNGYFEPGTSTPGAYVYSVASASGCTSTAVVTVTVLPASMPECIGAGIREQVPDGLSIRQDDQLASRLWIRSQHQLDADIQVFTVDGRSEFSKRIRIEASTPVGIDLPGPSSGVRLLHIMDRSSGQQRTIRLVM